MPTDLPTWGHMDQASPFLKFFPDGMVPLESLWPISVMRNGVTRQCYIIDWRYLTDDQLAGLAVELTQVWKPEITTVEEAVQYICETGLPMQVCWFSGAGKRGTRGVYDE